MHWNTNSAQDPLWSWVCCECECQDRAQHPRPWTSGWGRAAEDTSETVFQRGKLLLESCRSGINQDGWYYSISMCVFALLTSRFVFSLMTCVQQLDVEPKEESRAYTTFVIPRERESQLPVLMLSSPFSRYLIVSTWFKLGMFQLLITSSPVMQFCRNLRLIILLGYEHFLTMNSFAPGVFQAIGTP